VIGILSLYTLKVTWAGIVKRNWSYISPVDAPLKEYSDKVCTERFELPKYCLIKVN